MDGSMVDLGSIAELAAFLGKLQSTMLSMHLHYGRRVSGIHNSLQTSVSLIILHVMCHWAHNIKAIADVTG